MPTLPAFSNDAVEHKAVAMGLDPSQAAALRAAHRALAEDYLAQRSTTPPPEAPRLLTVTTEITLGDVVIGAWQTQVPLLEGHTAP